MTREEAREIIIKERDSLKANPRVKVEDCLYEAFDLAIKALEHEPVLDKIRAEIMQLDYDIESVDYDSGDMPRTEIVHTICREEVLHIIDKYKAERSDKE